MQLSRRKRWILFATAFGLLFPVLWHYYLRIDLASYRRSLVARGEKLEVKDLIPEAPGKSNGVPAFLNAAFGIQPMSYDLQFGRMVRIGPAKARVTWKEFANLQEDWRVPENYLQKFEKTMAGNETALAALKKASEAEELRFPITYDPAMLNFRNLSTVSRTTGELSSAALWYLYSGKWNEAWECLRAQTRLCSLLRDDRLLISFSIRCGMTGVALASTWESLQHDHWMDAQLRELQDLWEHMDFIKDAETAAGMERAFLTINAQRFRDDYFGTLPGVAGGAGQGIVLEFFDHLKEVAFGTKNGIQEFLDRYPRYTAWRWLHSYSDEKEALMVWQDLLEVLRRARSDAALGVAMKAFGAKYPRPVDRSFDRRISEAAQAYSVGMISRLLHTEVDRHMVVAAIALKRFQMKHGHYPARLEALVPEFVATVPLDRMDGKPLRYRPNPDGTYVLYSVGLDLEDNTGRDEVADNKGTFGFGPDKVWPSAATHEEVATYYANEKRKRGGK